MARKWKPSRAAAKEFAEKIIHAGKARIMEIYNDLAAGYELDGRGNRK